MTRAALAAALLLLATGAAQAHTVIPGIGGFPGGLLHPLLAPAHALTLIALGLLLGGYAARIQVLLLGAFAVAAVAAFGLIAMAFAATQTDTLILGLGAAMGLLLATGLLPPAPAALIPTAAIAAALVFDSVPPVLTVSETALALTGTAISALALVAASAFVSGTLPPRVGRFGIRIAGSWIAASAIMVLALRLSAG